MQYTEANTLPPNDCINRWQGEKFDDYFIRLCENKKKYNLNYQQIADILNKENGKNYDESAYRKKFVDFNRGRIYEREHSPYFVDKRILAISDLHIPFQIPVDTFDAYSGIVDCLVLNGDILDCQSISLFPKYYRINLIDEMILARDYLINLINLIMPKTVILTKGNHEYRLLRYLSDKLNDDIMNLMPDSPLDLIVNDGFKNNDRYKHVVAQYPSLKDIFAESGIEVIYDGNWYCRIGNVIFTHPLTYSSPIMKTTDKAVAYFSTVESTRDFTAIVMAHTHKVGFYKSGDIRMYEQGCCCRINELDYANGKLHTPQQNGYMYICLNASGDIIEEKTKLITEF